MSDISKRGKDFELKVAKMLRLKIDRHAQRNKGSHANWQRRSDVYTELPIHLECKDQENIQPKAWFRQAEDAAFGKTPVVAFQMDLEVLALIKLDDLLNLFIEIADQKLEIEDLRQPRPEYSAGVKRGIEMTEARKSPQFTDGTLKRKVNVCPNGHIVDSYGYCQIKGCKYTRFYKPPKAKDKK